jgi:type IV pilus assembly protein PilC
MLPFAFLAFVAMVAVVWASTTIRWFFPVVGRFYRMQVQSRVLDMLAELLAVNTPAPEALGLLAASPALRGIASRKLTAARRAVERGEPLIEALRRRGLLRGNAVAFIHAAQRTNRLPWALRQLGGVLNGRAARFLRQFSLAMTPVSVLAVGSLVAFVVLAIFWPLIQLLAELS